MQKNIYIFFLHEVGDGVAVAALHKISKYVIRADMTPLGRCRRVWVEEIG